MRRNYYSMHRMLYTKMLIDQTVLYDLCKLHSKSKISFIFYRISHHFHEMVRVNIVRNEST